VLVLFAGFEAIRTGKGGIAEGIVSGVVLGAVWRGVTIVSDRSGLTDQVITVFICEACVQTIMC